MAEVPFKSYYIEAIDVTRDRPIASPTWSIFNAGTSDLASLFEDDQGLRPLTNPINSNPVRFFANADTVDAQVAKGAYIFRVDGVEPTAHRHVFISLPASLTIPVDHGGLVGLADDDHTQYLHLNKAAQTLQQNLAVAALATIDGVDISVHQAGDAKAQHAGGAGTHSHQSAGAEGGQLDHGLALMGLGDDDHTQYLKEKAVGGLAAEVPEHTHASAAEAGGVLSPATLVIPSSTLASLPAAGTAGRLARVTDDVRGLATDLGDQWLLENAARGIPVEWFGAKGDGSTDDATAISSAITAMPSGGMLLFRAGKTYAIASGVTLDGKNNVTLASYGGKRGLPEIKWTGAAAATTAMLKIRRSSYVTVRNLTFNAGATNKAGYGIWITSDGTGVTQFNTVRECRAYNASNTGIKIGDTNNLDTNVDGNQIVDCLIDDVTVTGIAIDGSNVNMTSVRGGAITGGSSASILIGTFARGVYIDRVLFIDSQTTGNGVGHVKITKKFSGLVEISNIVVEQFRHPFLLAEADDATDVASGRVVIRNYISTCNLPNDGTNLMRFLQHGMLVIENAFIAGIADGTNTYIHVEPTNISGPGQRLVLTRGVHRHSGAQFNIVQGSNAAVRRIGEDIYSTGPGVSAGGVNFNWLNAGFLTLTDPDARLQLVNNTPTTGKTFQLRSLSDGTFDILDHTGNPFLTRDANARVILGQGSALFSAISVVATASLPAAGVNANGIAVIEDAGAGDRNLIIYAGGQRFRIDGGVAF